MTWLAPGYLFWGGVAVVAVAALHLLARRRPPAEDLPTARFVPSRALHVTSRGIAPSDALLFVIRALALIAIAAAFAAPLVRRARSRVQRVIVVDESRAVASAAELRDSVRAVLREGDVVVSFDSAARTVTPPRVDSIARTDSRGSLSAAFVAAARAAGALATTADSLELVVVSPLVAEEADAATSLTRDAWPGRARLVSVRARAADTAIRSLDVEAADDALLASMRLGGAREVSAALRVRRAQPSGADSAWAGERNHVLVHWPRSGDATIAWRRRARLDTVAGAASGDAVVVAPLLRAWALDEKAGRVVARWVDGEPAAVEHARGGGCIRDVAIDVDPASDAPLRPEFRRLTTALLAPCFGAGVLDARPAADSMLARLAGVGRLASTDDFRSASGERSPWTSWLFGAALALLALEWAARRERRGAQR